MSEPTRITVRTDNPYDVVVGRGLLGELPAMLGPDPERVAIIHPAAQRGAADAVRAQGALAVAFRGEVGIGQHNFIAMAHVAEHLEQCRGDQGRNATQHSVPSVPRTGWRGLPCSFG